MGRPVCFIDTSVLAEIVGVPHMDQHRAEILDEFERRRAGELFVMPITTIIETGNHIAHVANGRLRRSTAEAFAKLLRATMEDRAPWVLHEATWGASFIERLLEGTDGVPGLVDAASSEMGVGDLAILAEADTYRARTSGVSVRGWSRDGHLAAYGA